MMMIMIMTVSNENKLLNIRCTFPDLKKKNFHQFSADIIGIDRYPTCVWSKVITVQCCAI